MQLWRLSVLFSVLSASTAESGFLADMVDAAQQTLGLNKVQPVRIAIIGAGAGGSSAAFWIQKAKERHGLDVEVHIFDKAGYIGGRSTAVHPYDDPSLPVEEIGGAVFVKANKILFRACEEFGLKVRDLEMDDADMAIYNGDGVTLTYTSGFFENLKLLKRYGYSSPTKTNAIVQDMIEKLLKSYTPQFPVWSSIEELSDALGFTNYTTQTGMEFYTSRGVSEQFAEEMIAVATRYNYAQDIRNIHGLEAAVSMAANGASQVEAGNYKIFEKFIEYSGAQLFLNTTVTGLAKSSASGKVRWTLSGPSHNIPLVAYDHVIVAAPIHNAKIAFRGTTEVNFNPPVKYIHLHVTIVSTTSFRPKPERFGLKAGAYVPRMFLTTSGSKEFTALMWHRSWEHKGRKENVFKVFSFEKLEDKWLEGVFGEGTLGWIRRAEWDAYPVLPPVSQFPPIKPDDGLWYANSMESWISTLETTTLSARNVVDNVLRETFGVGICPATTSEDGWGTKVEDNKVYGWDC